MTDMLSDEEMAYLEREYGSRMDDPYFSVMAHDDQFFARVARALRSERAARVRAEGLLRRMTDEAISAWQTAEGYENPDGALFVEACEVIGAKPPAYIAGVDISRCPDE